MKKYVVALLFLLSVSLLLSGCKNDINENSDKTNKDIYEEIDNRENILSSINDKEITIYHLDDLNKSDKKNKDLPYVYSISLSNKNDGSFVVSDGDEALIYKRLGTDNNGNRLEVSYKYAVPYFNIDMDGIDTVNYTMKAIATLFNSTYNEFYKLNPEMCGFGTPTCYFTIDIKNNILSVKAKYNSTYNEGTIAYNLDLKNKKVLSFDSFIKELGLEKEKVLDELRNHMLEEINNKAYLDNKDIEYVYKKVMSTIDKNNYFYLGEINLNNSLKHHEVQYNDDSLNAAGGYNTSYYILDNKLVIEYSHLKDVQNGWTRATFNYDLDK